MSEAADFDPRRIDFEYPLWIAALDRAGGPVPDGVVPNDPTVNYLSGAAGETGRCIVAFTDEPAAEHCIEGLKLPGARLMRVPDVFEFLALLRTLSARGYTGVVFDPLPTNRTAFPAPISELIDDAERRTRA